MKPIQKLTKEYLQREYKQAILDFKGAINENEQWQARKSMAQLERLAAEMYGFDFADKLHDYVKELQELQ